MGHCKDCRHWDGRRSDQGDCALGSSDMFGQDVKASLAWAQADGDEKARLCTKQHFGCVQFEVRDHDEAREQAISDLIEKIANLPGITPADLELLAEITGHVE